MRASPPTWDVFCRVVDNFGDAAIAWRLARQLADEHALAVRLFIDGIGTLARLCPAVDARAPVQRVAGVEVRDLALGIADVVPGDVVIDVLGGGLPEAYVARTAARAAPSAWIITEHLSAEPWVASFHGRASPQPATGRARHFFFPGFVPGTGGLWRERGYAARREAADAAGFWRSIGYPPPPREACTLSLFAYPTAPLAPLVECWMHSSRPLVVAVADGPLAARVSALHRPGGALEVRPLPFLAQDDYDRLLWACDWNFVRGEDSLTRALWAARPLVWQPYVQEQSAHLAKLDAFIDWYAPEVPAYRGFARAWSAGAGPGAGEWEALMRHEDPLRKAAVAAAGALERLGEFTANLVAFARSRLN